MCIVSQVLRRHVIPNVVISLEEMIIAAYGTSLKADSGDEIAVQKPTENGQYMSLF